MMHQRTTLEGKRRDKNSQPSFRREWYRPLGKGRATKGEGI